MSLLPVLTAMPTKVYPGEGAQDNTECAAADMSGRLIVHSYIGQAHVTREMIAPAAAPFPPLMRKTPQKGAF